MMHHEVLSEMHRRGTPLRGISLIPRLPPGQASRCPLTGLLGMHLGMGWSMGALNSQNAQVEATTRGVRVRASVIFQMDGPATARSGYLFAYRCDVVLAKGHQITCGSMCIF